MTVAARGPTFVANTRPLPRPRHPRFAPAIACWWSDGGGPALPSRHS